MKRSTHHVDDFFRETLRGYQLRPSEAARRRFLTDAPAIRTNVRRRRLTWLLVVTGIFLLGTATFLFWPKSTQETTSGITSTESGIINETAAIPALTEQSRSSVAKSLKMAATPGQPVLITADEPQGDPEPVIPSEPVLTVVNIPVTEGTPEYIKYSDTTLPDSTFREPEVHMRRKAAGQDMIPGVWLLSISAYYAPEWMFNILEGEKYVNNAGIESIVRYGRYSIRTGVGISVTTGTNELSVAYNDYLGSYNMLDSMQFHWDEQNYHLVPTYFFSTKDAWDSLLRMDYPRVIKRYTYLQIPLILGYDVLQKEWISLGLRAGPIVSILLNSKQLSEDYDPGRNRIIRINQITPDRIQTNWQVMGGLNVSLRLTSRISLEIEPTIKYYFNSVYEKSDITKKPWSAGFRTAVMIRL